MPGLHRHWRAKSAYAPDPRRCSKDRSRRWAHSMCSTWWQGTATPAKCWIISTFRNRIGESLAAIQQHDVPLLEAVTPSLEALQAYSAGYKSLLSADPTAAVPLFQRAVALDPNFAMAYARLARAFADTAQPEAAAAALTKAYELRQRVGDRDQFWIASAHDMMVTGNLESARHSTEAWVQAYPRDTEAHNLLSVLYQQLGRYSQAVSEGEKAIETAPDFPPSYNNLIWSYIFDKRLNDAQRILREGQRRKFDMPDLMLLPYYIAFLQGDAQGMQNALSAARQKPESEDWVTHAESLVAAYTGHLAESRTLSKRAVDLARQSRQEERAMLYLAGAAVRESFLGDAGEARRIAKEAAALSKNRDVVYGAAFALANAGSFDDAAPLLADLERRYPEDTYVKFTYLPVVRALIAVRKQKPGEALQLLEVAAPYELGLPGSWFGLFGELYPIYVRGEAYLAAGQPTRAAEEFHKFAANRQVVWADPVGVVVARRLAEIH